MNLFRNSRLTNSRNGSCNEINTMNKNNDFKFAITSPILAAFVFVCYGFARSADSFVNSIGVNTHIKFTTGTTPYTNAQILTILGQLGVRHIRDDMPLGSSAYSRLAGLYNTYGIRVNWVPYTWGRTAPPPSQVVGSLKTNAFFEAIEGPNESDLASTPYSYNGFTDNPPANTYAGTRAWQNDVYAAVKGDPLTSATPMFSPAMAFSVNAQYMNPISMDYEAINAVFLENYWNQGSVKRQARWFDNFVISTRPIGPIIAMTLTTIFRTGPLEVLPWEVQMAASAEGSDIVWQSTPANGKAVSLHADATNGFFCGSRVGSASLVAFGTTYWLRIRQVGESDWSPWHAPFKC